MSLNIKHKRSAIDGKAPLPTDLNDGEIAVNYNAKSPAAYIKDSAGAVVQIAGAGAVGTAVPATETVSGTTELATQAETDAGTDDTRSVTPLKAATRYVSKDAATGGASLPSGTTAERPAGPVGGELRLNTDTTEFEGFDGTGWTGLKPAGAASETAAGVAELATQAEVDAGADDATIVTPLKLRTTADARYVGVTGDTMTGGLTVPSLNGGQLAGLRNVLVNGAVSINQRGKTYAGVANGEYWADRWKKTAGGMTQVVESGNFKPSTVYTLSGTGVTTSQVTSPATGDWTIPTVSSTATNIQLEEGTVATPFELRPAGLELSLCQRYYQASTWPITLAARTGGSTTARAGNITFNTSMRANPTCTFTTTGIATVSANAHSSFINFRSTATAAGSESTITGYTADAEL